jgi:membrane peptidoglycan carboxypeptidase
MKYPPLVQVLKPETVMTMRMMMRRVVMPGGTAHRLHVVGYSIAGKTGTAQIFDFAHHVYTHKYNASFLGFAPATNPRLAIVVTVSGTTGEAGFGGAAAGPAFQTVMATALRRLGVTRDVPEEIEEVAEKEKKSAPAKDTDDVALAELNPPTEQEMQAASDEAGADAARSVTIDPNTPKLPNFVGKAVKDVLQEAASSGIDVEMSGDGLARAQNPPAGTLLIPGEHIQVRFAR